MSRYIAVAEQDVGTCESLQWAALAIAPMVLAEGDDADEVREAAEQRAGHDAIYVHDREPPRLVDYQTGETIRRATGSETRRSEAAAEQDGGRGVIMVDGRSCYVEA